jgi:hypothetical protein
MTNSGCLDTTTLWILPRDSEFRVSGYQNAEHYWYWLECGVFQLGSKLSVFAAFVPVPLLRSTGPAAESGAGTVRDVVLDFMTAICSEPVPFSARTTTSKLALRARDHRKLVSNYRTVLNARLN